MIHSTTESRISQRAYYSFRFHPRADESSIILSAGRLFQEFCVDACAQIIQNRLRWVTNNQQKIRADMYQGLADAINNGTDLSTVGTRKVLPSSFTGSDRNMSGRYYDAMAVVRARSKPDLFITVTCNPKWNEITECLNAGDTAESRPDIVSRVFHLKLRAIMHDLVNVGVFGKVVAHMYSVEFQKRGLPHAHILLILTDEDKPRTIEQIDRIVSAQIPDPAVHAQLYDTVANCMLHGPCGSSKADARCMVDGKCSKKFPKTFLEETTIPADGYPKYRRPNNGRTINQRGFDFDNRHVVPFNPYLCAKYNCHINVEIANGIVAVKYLYKYVYKGHDRASIMIDNDTDEGGDQPQPEVVDEIKQYLHAHYVSPCEACWRIFNFPLYDLHPPVQRLQLHLPDQHTVYFDPDDDPDSVLSNRRTTLTAFFDACRKYPEHSAGLLYPDVVTKFTWKKKERIWTPRVKGTSVGRVYFATPTDGERYYLRLLLYNVKSPTSYEDLRTVDGQLFPTFNAACIARGLLEDDDEWDACMREAVTINTGQQLRRLFSVILLGNSPASPLNLFQTYVCHLSDDCRQRLQTQFNIHEPSDLQVLSLCLHLIQQLLQQSGKTLSDYGLPDPPIPFDELHGVPRIIADELHYDRDGMREIWESGYTRLNGEQKLIVDTIIASINSPRGRLFFVDGPGGTGKTFVENLLLAYARSQGHIALAVASSGIASTLLVGGRTSHSRFKIPLNIFEDSVCEIKAQTPLADLFRMTKLIIWDEAPAQHRYCFEAVDRTLKDILQNDHCFGGITVVFAGNGPLLPIH